MKYAGIWFYCRPAEGDYDDTYLGRASIFVKDINTEVGKVSTFIPFFVVLGRSGEIELVRPMKEKDSLKRAVSSKGKEVIQEALNDLQMVVLTNPAALHLPKWNITDRNRAVFLAQMKAMAAQGEMFSENVTTGTLKDETSS